MRTLTGGRVAAACLLVVAAACSSDKFSPTEGAAPVPRRTADGDGEFPLPDGPTGSVAGTVYAANGERRIAGVRVFAAYQGVETVSAQNGEFALAGVPVGRQEIFFEKGVFSAKVRVVVEEGVTTWVNLPVLLAVDAERIAIVSGSYDRIEDVLGRLGYSGFPVYDGFGWAPGVKKNIASLVGNARELEKYYAVFLNCGLDTTGAADPEVKAALRAYTAGGGKLYASDWAYDYVEQAFPERATFYGDDSVPNTAQAGAGGTIMGTVLDAPLASYLGKTQVELNYNLGGWVVMLSSGVGTSVFVSGNVPSPQVPDAPLMISFPEGGMGGRVVYTTFHNEAQTSKDMDEILEYLIFDL